MEAVMWKARESRCQNPESGSRICLDQITDDAIEKDIVGTRLNAIILDVKYSEVFAFQLESLYSRCANQGVVFLSAWDYGVTPYTQVLCSRSGFSGCNFSIANLKYHMNNRKNSSFSGYI